MRSSYDEPDTIFVESIDDAGGAASRLRDQTRSPDRPQVRTWAAAVAPAWPGQRIGSSLVRVVLVSLLQQGMAGCAVWGSPRHYERFGFRSLPGLWLPGRAIAF